MKKVFPLIDDKMKPARVLERVKGEISKYLKRERRKALPEGVDYWDFDCRVGATSEVAIVVHIVELPKKIEQAQLDGADQCYVEILAKRGVRRLKDSATK